MVSPFDTLLAASEVKKIGGLGIETWLTGDDTVLRKPPKEGTKDLAVDSPLP